MNITVTTDYPLSRVDEIISYLAGPRLFVPLADYPDFGEWAQKAHIEIKKESKRAIIALAGNDLAGVVLYQRHKKIRNALELKNLTVRPDQRGRYLASFLIRNAEIEGAHDFKATQVYCDAKASNAAVRLFLSHHCYQAIATEDLYTLGAGKDIIYRKDIRPATIRTYQ